MGIQNQGYDAVFGAPRAAAPVAANEDRVPAQYYLNIGYSKPTTDADGNPTTTFVSLSRGVGLDTMEIYDLTEVHAPKMRAVRNAQNKLHQQYMAVAETLAPGETAILNVQIEVRHKRSGAAATPVEDDDSLVMDLGFLKQAAG